MQIARASALLFSLSLVAACGDDGPTKLPDAGIGNTDVMPKVCTTVTNGIGDITGETAGSFISWGADANEQFNGNDVAIFVEFYHSVTPDITGAIDLGSGDQTDFATCGVCFYAASFTPSGELDKFFFQKGGTVTFTEDPIDARRLHLTVTGLELGEASLNNQGSSTLLPNGACLSLNGDFMEDNVPAEWASSCAPEAYYGAQPDSTCDCNCGVFDPDCGLPGATERTEGCTAGTPTCWPDELAETVCVASVANDTCQTATELTVGAAATAGNTKGADRDYTQPTGNTCTKYRQNGPDVVYKVELTQGTEYTITLAGVQAPFDPSLTIIGPDENDDAAECTPSFATCAAGVDEGVEGEGETITFTPTTTGTYYIIIDTFYTTIDTSDPDPAFHIDLAGPFTIQVTQ